MQQMLLEGKTFVGCVQAASKAAATQATTAGRAPNATTVADLLSSLQPSDTVVLTERVVASRGGALFLKPSKVTVAALMSVSTPGASSSTLPGRRAPTSEAWGQAQSLVAAAAAASATSVDTAGNDTTVLAAMAQAAAAELAAASVASVDVEPAADLVDGAGGGNRRLAQVVDNRQWIRDTTAWPWPALSKITVGCSGTLMSPGELH
jgi:V8-like Glu-specific endopeptidase